MSGSGLGGRQRGSGVRPAVRVHGAGSQGDSLSCRTDGGGTARRARASWDVCFPGSAAPAALSFVSVSFPRGAHCASRMFQSLGV